VEWAGRQFVVKRDAEIDRRLEKKVWSFLAGTTCSRQIKLTAKAIKNGCSILQDVYLVKEKMAGRLCQEAYVVAEYVPGQSFLRENPEAGRPPVFIRPGENLPRMAEALGVLHQYGLASNDAKASNFILTPQGEIKIIDLTANTPVFLAKVNDVLQMRKLYAAEVPINDWLTRILTRVMAWHRSLKLRLRVWRKKIPAQSPPKIWEDSPAADQAKLVSGPQSPGQDLTALSQEPAPDGSPPLKDLKKRL
jgi:heptose II phosphotransferase